MAGGFLDFLHARVVEGNREEADAILAKHFAGHEARLESYTQAWEAAEQISPLMTPQGQAEVRAELARMRR